MRDSKGMQGRKNESQVISSPMDRDEMAPLGNVRPQSDVLRCKARVSVGLDAVFTESMCAYERESTKK